jgi:hypothetical protein
MTSAEVNPGITPNPTLGVPSVEVPGRKASGWTPINPESPYTPGPQSQALSTAFFEPPIDKSPGVPIFEAPNKCGPNSPRCDDQQYCDPQPLCDTGTSCPGICLPLYGGKFSMPDSLRNQIWDKVMSEGIYKVKVTVTQVRQVVQGSTTLIKMVKRAQRNG